MFTRCPECRTVFHISAAELKAADGTVICGACETTFDALDSLSETRPEDTGPPVAATRDEEEATEAGEVATEPTDGEEQARDEDEFLQELESLIGEDDGEGPGADEDEAAAHEDEHEDGVEVEVEVEVADDDDYELPDPDSVFRVDDVSAGTEEAYSGPFVGEDEEDELKVNAEPVQEKTPVAGGGEIDAGSEPDEPPGNLPAETSESIPEFARDEEPHRDRLWIRLVLVLLAVLLLAATWAHSQRGKLLRHPAGEAVLGSFYSVFGIDAEPTWSPADFRAVKWEAVADPERPGQLIVAVDFVNKAPFAQPYPIIRIALQDRFGRRVGRHDFAPKDYLEGHSTGSRLPAEGRVRTTIEVPDPEAQAEGFRVDFCLEMPAKGLVCGPELFR